MPRRKVAPALLLILAATTGAYAAQSLLPKPGPETPQQASAMNPHFDSEPEISTDNGALLVEARVAGLDDAPVSVVLAATAVTTCTNRNGRSGSPSIEQTLTAARPHLSPRNGAAEFAIRTEPIEAGCEETMRARTHFRSIVLSLYQDDRVVLERVFALGR